MVTKLLLLAAVALLVFSMPALADVGLADWCINNNGSVGAGTNQPANSCNGGTLASDPNVNISKFDTSLEAASNAAGTSPQSITISFGTGTQNIGVFMNYDLDYSTYGSSGDYGTANGTFPATFTYEMDNEFNSGIFSDFAAGALTGANNVSFATCSANYPPEYCDASWAMDWVTFVDPTKFTGGSITYTVSTATPATSFYLQQTSGLSCQPSGTGASCDNLYLSASVTLTPIGSGPPPPIPEPSAWVLLSTVIGGLFLARKRLLARTSKFTVLVR